MPSPTTASFAREFTSPLPPSHWLNCPRFAFIAFYEHSGAFREAWPPPSCSVAHRPTDVEPGVGKAHYIFDVHEFLAHYPHPIDTHNSHVECTHTTWAQHKFWPDFIREGKILRTAEEFLLMLYIGKHAALEHPPSALEHVIGPSDFRMCTFDYADPTDSTITRKKNLRWWLRNLTAVPDTHTAPEHLRRDRHSHANPEVQMLLRSTISPFVAKPLASAWAAEVQDAPPQTDRPATAVDAGYTEHRTRMLCNYAAFAAQYAPVVRSQELARADRPRLVVAVPIGFYGELAALVPLQAECFAVPHDPTVGLLDQVMQLAAFLPCHEQPQEMSITRDAVGDFVFALPFTTPVTTAAADRLQLSAAMQSRCRAAWVCAAALSDRQYEHTALAMQRAQSLTQPTPWLSGRIGIMPGPVPVTPNREARRFAVARTVALPSSSGARLSPATRKSMRWCFVSTKPPTAVRGFWRLLLQMLAHSPLHRVISYHRRKAYPPTT